MYRECKVCGEHKWMTVHHFHWPKNYIKQWYPKQYERLRSVKQFVCEECHSEFHLKCNKCMGRISMDSPNRNCYDCKYATICCYWKRGE